jgi:GAF domain-containing protein
MAEQDPITAPHRVSALRRTGLLDSPPEEAFDQLARMAASATSAPIALVSLVDEDRQYFKSAVGEMTGPMSAEQETSLSYSLCRHAVASASPLVLPDARADALFSAHPAVQNAGVGAYLGVPIVLEDGSAIGTVCVLDSKPRDWGNAQVETLQRLAGNVAAEIARRNAAVDGRFGGSKAAIETPAERLRAAARGYFAQREAYAQALSAPDAATSEGLSRETARRAALVDSEASLLRASTTMEAMPEDAVALQKRCAEFLEAEVERGRASLRFRRGEISLEGLERAAGTAAAAEEAMQLALRDYEMRGG